MVLFWIAIIVIAIILEAATVSLVSVWFAVGAIGALITSALTDSLLIQFTVFTLISVVCIFYTRPFLQKFMGNRKTPTNLELVIGKTAVVIETIDNALAQGRAKLDGVDWRAVSLDDSIIEKDTSVTVTDIKSAKLIVKKIDD